jgi:hypothetical protein
MSLVPWNVAAAKSRGELLHSFHAQRACRMLLEKREIFDQAAGPGWR